MAKWTLVIHGGASTSLINRDSKAKPAGGPKSTKSGIVRLHALTLAPPLSHCQLASSSQRGLKMEGAAAAAAC